MLSYTGLGTLLLVGITVGVGVDIVIRSVMLASVPLAGLASDMVGAVLDEVLTIVRNCPNFGSRITWM